MSKFRLAQVGRVVATIGLTALLSSSYAAETVRPEIGNPLLAAQNLMKAGKNKEALAKLRELDAVGGKSANENYLIERTRAAAATKAGDNDAAARSFEALLASGKLSAGEAAQFSEGLVGIYMRARDYGKANAAILRQLKERNDPKLRAYLMQNYYNMGNTAQFMQELRAEEKAGRVPSEDAYGMLANLQNKSNDKNGYVATIEKLATYYPNANYWNDLLNRVTGKSGFASRLAVDVYRLKFQNNLIKKPSEFMEMSQLVLQAKAPAEAVKVVERGYKAGALGTGAEASRHQRLKDLADKEAAAQLAAAAATEATLTRDGDHDGLAALGYGLVQAGKTAQGLKLIEAAVKSGKMKYPEDGKLRLGEAYHAAGKKAQAIATLKTVGGKEGTADLARYWIMAINRPMN